MATAAKFGIKELAMRASGSQFEDRGDSSPARLANERMYTPQEVAERFKVTPKHVRGMFEHEPGVIFLPSPGKVSKRRYRVMRIPENVLSAFCARYAVREVV